jgi:hypothetical protein
VAKFAIDSKVKAKQIDGSIHYDQLVGLEGIVTNNHDEWSDGSKMCPHIMVDIR